MNEFTERHAAERERNRRADGRFGEALRGEADLDLPTSHGINATAQVATLAVSPHRRGHLHQVFGFQPSSGESLCQADARLALEHRSTIDREDYTALASAQVLATGEPLHPDDQLDAGYLQAVLEEMGEDESRWDPAAADLADSYASEAATALDRFFDVNPGVVAPF